MKVETRLRFIRLTEYLMAELTYISHEPLESDELEIIDEIGETVLKAQSDLQAIWRQVEAQS
jgi:hypothetical protein